jgi:AraC family transcriptional regulator of adaptative response / DNA-3-methyladenine glycosylase II
MDMELDRRVCDRARCSRDARFDGRFFICVTTTRVYCRPICPARAPNAEHIRYLPTAAAAEAAGYRPCLRCRPEAAPGTPAWPGTSAVVSRALRLIDDGALDDDGVERLAGRLGVTARHLRRLFVRHLGAAPLDIALTRRVHFAKTLLDETSLPVRDVAFASGFGSVRRFNSQMRRTFARTPTELRRLARRQAMAAPTSCRFRLAYRPPYDWDAMLAFLSLRATPGVEAVSSSGYRRTIVVNGKTGVIGVSRHESGDALALDVRFPDPRALLQIVERVRRMFDLGADPAAIAEHLGGDPLLRAPLSRHPGVRVPGAWNDFELAVRAILGQQISVRAATTIAGRVAAMFGSACPDAAPLERLFPTAEQLAQAPIERAGVIASRAEAIRTLARHVAAGGSIADRGELRGIGPWTSAYIAMRVGSEPDAFPSGDVVLRRMAGALSARALDQRSNAWRPWRAYAVMLLWQKASEETQRPRGAHHGGGSRRKADAAAYARIQVTSPA